MTRRKLLGRFDLDDQLVRDIERSGLLDVVFTSTRGDTSLVSEDGARSIAWLAPSGEIAGLLVQDYVVAESRLIPFAFGALEVVADGDELSVYQVAE